MDVDHLKSVVKPEGQQNSESESSMMDNADTSNQSMERSLTFPKFAYTCMRKGWQMQPQSSFSIFSQNARRSAKFLF